jgi:hypothetical protein
MCKLGAFVMGSNSKLSSILLAIKKYIFVNIPNTCSTIYFNINMHKYYKSLFKVKSMTSTFKKSNINYIKLSITYL